MKNLVYRIGGLLLALSGFTANAVESSHVQPTTELRIVKYAAPQYPGFAKLQGLNEGTVVLAFSHGLEGRVTDALALESTGDAFTREAIYRNKVVLEWNSVFNTIVSENVTNIAI
jgi:hypothetical protein